MRRLTKIVTKKILLVLPDWLKHEVVRSSIRLPEKLSPDLTFKIANTTQELEDSFKLVYNSYLGLGYCDSNSYGMRATIFHALPTTTTLVATDRGHTVGTLTIVRDNLLGLPLDKVFNVDSLRDKSKRIAEITSLVIHKDYRREKGGQILFPLLRLMYQYSTTYFGVNQLLVTIHPKDIDFYKSLLLFEQVEDAGVKNYLGAPSICLKLDLNKALFRYKETYSGRKKVNDLFNFFIEREIANILLPQREYNKINDPLVKLNYFQDVFVNQLQLFASDWERKRVESCLRKNRIDQRPPRIEVEAPANFDRGQMVVKDVSRLGFRSVLLGAFQLKEEYSIQIEIAPEVHSEVIARPVWMSSERGIGFEIINADESWTRFIDFLYQEQFGKMASGES